MNRDYVAAIRKANGNMRPDFMSVGGYDGMHPTVQPAAMPSSLQ
jgi:hypothetical protein